MKTPKASGALRQAPDPMPTYTRFARMTLLRYMSAKSGGPELGPPLGQILDPLLFVCLSFCLPVSIHPTS